MRGVQHLRQPGEGGRAQHVQVQALHLLRPAADQAAGHRPERHIRPPARPGDHQQHPQPVPRRLRQLRMPGRPQMGADKRPRAQRHRRIRCPGRAAAPTPAPAPHPGRCPPPPAPQPAGPAPAPRSPPHPRRRTPAGTTPRPPAPAAPPPPARSPAPGRRGTRRNPPDTSGPAPRPASPDGAANSATATRGAPPPPARSPRTRRPPARPGRDVADPQLRHNPHPQRDTAMLGQECQMTARPQHNHAPAHALVRYRHSTAPAHIRK